MKINLQLFGYYAMENGKLVWKSSTPSASSSVASTMASAGANIANVKNNSTQNALTNTVGPTVVSAGANIASVKNDATQKALANTIGTGAVQSAMNAGSSVAQTAKPSAGSNAISAGVTPVNNPTPSAQQAINTGIVANNITSPATQAINTGVNASTQAVKPTVQTPTVDPTVAPTVTEPVNTKPTLTAPTVQNTIQQSTYVPQKSQNMEIDTALMDRLKNLSSQSNIVSQEVIDQINKPFQVSQAYTDAMAYTNKLLEQLGTGRTSYTDQLNAIMDEIKSRDKFQYDLDSDVLFQQSLASYMNQGANAMQDTMAQASALTGGYGSSYATSVANQAYNSFIQDAYNNLPQYYSMALDAYNAEGDDMYRQFAMLSDQDAKEYERNYNAFTQNFNLANDMYGKEYTKWSDDVKNALNMAGLQMDQSQQLWNENYNLANMINDNYWKDAQLQESIRQYNNNFNQSVNEFNANMQYKYDSLNAGKDQWEKEYQATLDKANQAQKNWEAEFNASIDKANQAQKNWEAEYNASLESASQKASSSQQLTRKQNWATDAMNEYNLYGEEGLERYLDSLPQDADLEWISDYALKHGYHMESDYFTFIGNDKVRDAYGNEYTISSLPKDKQEEFKKLKKQMEGN